MRRKRWFKLSGYLEKTCSGYGAVLGIPESLHDAIGRSHLCRDLGTSDPATAEIRLYPALLGIHTELHAVLDRGWNPAETGDLGLCVEEWLADADHLGTLKPETRAAYRAGVRNFAAWCIAEAAFLMPGQVSSQIATQHVKFLQAKGVSRSLIEIRIAAMSGLWEWMKHRARTPEMWQNPWKRQMPPRDSGRLPLKGGKGTPSEVSRMSPLRVLQTPQEPQEHPGPSSRPPWHPVALIDPQRWRGVPRLPRTR